ncbi:hypothetical protein FS837_012286 [Tulasnella sp. UAMH 9824]|nr:hypothetical protein FS837_012286 [Tulasnella sp. UAMH 9824]
MAERKDQLSAMDIETSSALQLTLNELAHLLIKPSQLSILNASKIGSGGYGEVFFATLDGSAKVAVKQLRITHAQEMRIRVAMRLARELRIWAKVNHPNVLKLVGYYLSDNYGCAQFVSPFIPNGNITEYMERTQAGAEARLRFANVLINNGPEAVLCDFGLATFVEESGGPSGLTTSRSTKGSIRYMSPELLQTADAKHTLESDVWAWACTTFEVLRQMLQSYVLVDTQSLDYRSPRTVCHILLPRVMVALFSRSRKALHLHLLNR